MKSVKEEIALVRRACMEVAQKSARQQSLNECIDKTREMCNRFNNAALDLRNQLDTTDMYIEHYLPFRTIKEVSYMLHNSFDQNISNKVRVFEAKRIQQHYARMIHTAHKVPNFKARLTDMRNERGDEIPGFGSIDRKGLPTEKLTLPF